MKKLALIATALFMTVNTAQAATYQASDFIGSWKCNATMSGLGYSAKQQSNITFFKNGTHKGNSNTVINVIFMGDSNVQENTAGDWNLQGDVINYRVTSGSANSKDYPEVAQEFQEDLKNPETTHLKIMSLSKNSLNVRDISDDSEAPMDIHCVR